MCTNVASIICFQNVLKRLIKGAVAADDAFVVREVEAISTNI